MGDNESFRQRLIDRRTLLGSIGTGATAFIAGCTGNGGDTPTPRVETRIVEEEGETVVKTVQVTEQEPADEYLQAAAELGLGENWRQRRIENARNNWPVEDRMEVPDRGSDTSWRGFESFETAVESTWQPPDGWEDTIAGEVDSLQILNHGAANMEFDPATLATHELFEEVTGIDLEPVEIGVDQANLKEQQFLSAGQGEPQLFNVDGTLMPVLTQAGWLEVVDPLYAADGVWEPYVPTLRNLTEWGIDRTRSGTHIYGFPNILEGSVGNLRPDLVEEQGIDPERFQGEWSWDLLEETMEAFEGTDVFGYAYYAGTPTYLFISFRQLLYQQGGRLVQDDGTVRIDTQAARNVLSKMREWRDNGWVPGDVISFGEGDIVDLFLSGRVAYSTAFSDFVPRSLSAYTAGEEYQVVVPPMANMGPNPEQAGVTAPNATAINPFADPAEKAAALLYGDLRLSYVSQWWEFTYEGNMSYMDSVYADANEADIVTFGDAIGRSIARGRIELFPQMQAIWQRLTSPFQSAIVGDLSPREATQQGQQFIDSVLSQ